MHRGTNLAEIIARTLRHIYSFMKTATPLKSAIANSSSTNRAKQPAPHQSPERCHHGRCILLVDDDPNVRDSLKEVLTGEGYVVIPAENGQMALDLIGKSSVDLVLLDLNMPVKNGWDTYEQLTRDYSLVPIIIVTARPNQLFTALSAGVGALLEKPMDIPTLLRTIEKLLAESHEQRLARLVGKGSGLHFKPSEANHKLRVTAKAR